MTSTLWNVAPLNQVAEVVGRGITPRYDENGDYVVLNQKCVRDGRVNINLARRHESGARPVKTEKRLARGDVLVNSTGVGTLGRTAFMTEVQKSVTADSHITIVRPHPPTCPEWLGYALRNAEPQIEAMAEGTTGQTELSRQSLAKLELFVPPPFAQQAIAATLGALDAKIETNRTIQHNLEQLNLAEFELTLSREEGKTVDFDQIVERLKVKPIAKTNISNTGSYSVWDQGASGLLGYSDLAPTLEATIENPVVLFGDHTCTLRLSTEPCHLGPNLIPFLSKAESGIHPIWLFFALHGKQQSQEYRRHWMELRQRPIAQLSSDSMDAFLSAVRPRLAYDSALARENRRLEGLRNALLPELLSGRMKVAELPE